MTPYLLNTLEFGPLVARRLLALIPSSRWDESNGDRFSVREAIAHLADWEPILQGRMKTTVESSGSAIQAYDESVRAEEMNYRALDPWVQIALWQQRRKQTAEWLRARPEGDWSKIGVHSERGEQSLLEQANMLLGHDLYHLEHLSGFLEEKTAGTW